MTNMIALMGEDYRPRIPELVHIQWKPLKRLPLLPAPKPILCLPAPHKDALFVGKQINVAGFAQDCTITAIVQKWGDEWATLRHPRFGTLHRKTKELLVRDLTP